MLTPIAYAIAPRAGKLLRNVAAVLLVVAVVAALGKRETVSPYNTHQNLNT